MAQPPSPQRQSVRLPLRVQAEVMNLGTTERVEGTTGNLSRGGCYVLCANPFPQWTSIRLWLTKGSQVFEAEASVVHATLGEGMGIAFERITPRYQSMLDGWLVGAG
jgi:hypothetical protein